MHTIAQPNYEDSVLIWQNQLMKQSLKRRLTPFVKELAWITLKYLNEDIISRNGTALYFIAWKKLYFEETLNTRMAGYNWTER
jgi:hypothetical protein